MRSPSPSPSPGGWTAADGGSRWLARRKRTSDKLDRRRRVSPLLRVYSQTEKNQPKLAINSSLAARGARLAAPQGAS